MAGKDPSISQQISIPGSAALAAEALRARSAEWYGKPNGLELAAEIVLRAARIDPRLLRWCSWPGCLASFHAVTGPPPGERWIRSRRVDALLCSDHQDAGHHPGWTKHNGDPDHLLANCSCGATGRVWPENLEAVLAWWERHVTTLNNGGRLA